MAEVTHVTLAIGRALPWVGFFVSFCEDDMFTFLREALWATYSLLPKAFESYVRKKIVNYCIIGMNPEPRVDTVDIMEPFALHIV